MEVDFSYNFQVIAFTNASDDTTSSDPVTYTVGPPFNAKNLAIDQSMYPQRPVVVTWSAPSTAHKITFYIVELAQFTLDEGVSGWKTFNYTSIQGLSAYNYFKENVDEMYSWSDI